MRVLVRLLLCAIVLLTLTIITSCDRDKGHVIINGRSYSPTLDLDQAHCRKPDYVMYFRTPVYVNNEAAPVSFIHYFDVDQAEADESSEHASGKGLPICLLQPGAKGQNFRGDEIIWQSKQHQFRATFANTVGQGCSPDSPFKNMPAIATATDTLVGSYPTGNGTGPATAGDCEYKVTFTGDRGFKVDPHLRIGK